MSELAQTILRTDSTGLVIVRAGKRSLHPGWVSPEASPKFDLLVTAYEDGVPGAESGNIARIDVPGPKIAGFRRIFAEHPELLDKYEYIAIIDDDIAVTQQQIEETFAIGRQYGLSIFQPSLTWNSYYSYAGFLQQSRYFHLRYSNFIEMMCPFFHTAALRQALPLFGLKLEVGIDLLWSRVFQVPWFKCAIIDKVAVRHTRPVGSTKVQQGFRADEPYDEQAAIALRMFGATFRGLVAYGAITAKGDLLQRRESIAWRSLDLWRAYKSTPVTRRFFVRSVSDYQRHCLVRPLNLSRIDLSACMAHADCLSTGKPEPQ